MRRTDSYTFKGRRHVCAQYELFLITRTKHVLYMYKTCSVSNIIISNHPHPHPHCFHHPSLDVWLSVVTRTRFTTTTSRSTPPAFVDPLYSSLLPSKCSKCCVCVCAHTHRSCFGRCTFHVLSANQKKTHVHAYVVQNMFGYMCKTWF